MATTVEGHRLSLTHLDKPLWPDGWTKGQALHYYARIADVMLPHVRRRPASFLRFPDGVGAQTFYVKTPPPGTPNWVPRADVPSRTEGTKPHVTVDDVASLIALGNLGCLEVHVPQWTAPHPELHDLLVVDLDPGPGTSIVQCARVALAVRALLAHDGLACAVKTSGSKGLHLYAPLRPSPAGRVGAYARSLARALSGALPDRVTATMAKAARTGKVFVDWSQNNTAKTTVAPYSLRAGPFPAVSAPVGWAEVESCERPEELVFTPQQVLDRVERYGDLLGGLLDPVLAGPLP
ncbi:non-homologous end-joining DNA ligase [Actinocrinis puniceicyclus]|uniref:non-homologous end-joining DNA ligase n=1 Tax=Actinocrinis puniceicyclus TaxID=977794 RepID=UPI0028A7EED1|nr:non-homologous end-joining DNA ligase [Actinocrinis puniceicyclus]